MAWAPVMANPWNLDRANGVVGYDGRAWALPYYTYFRE